MKLDNSYLLFKKRDPLFWMCLPLLYLLSLIYYLVVLILEFAYRMKILPTYRAKFKVVSVGNITLGGTGKTPLVEWIVAYLSKNGKSPGIIIRGYKKVNPHQDGIVKDKASYFDIGDEASMFKEEFKGVSICVGRDKIKSAQQLEKENCGVAILDDGFQHWRLKRDLDIVTIDASFSLFGQMLLPLGRLREPLNSLKRADIFVLTKTDWSQDNTQGIKKELKEINPSAPVVSSIYQPVCFSEIKTGKSFPIDSEKLADKPVFILSGIANPLYFDRMLSKLRLKIRREFIYPDHYAYKSNDLELINKLARDNDTGIIITTHKDAVKLKQYVNFMKNTDIYYLKIKLKITENEKEFSDRLLSLFNS
ncbi:MAG: tetraacyldisaccharide 4'-kinase [Candidatus Omnitrophica bacterium]|nr:tetraacyldisaccharide 4'-kinase [Candidatus Omnitrophota bacterium]MDD5351831.1 tetraacyldisaccharide 4'-kinase [Candidatus Omnitrophota bacterium]MDD5550657.1 tetraacyldisaccharide 4'-kinase [Candidatus Omnitrophota bacterium]